MVKFWYIKGDFYQERSKRIGASDVPALIPNPEKPTESLAGYGRTPIAVWQEKTGRKERDPAGLPAEMGHYLENKALELFIRENFSYDEGKIFLRRKTFYELNKEKLEANAYQMNPFYHNVQFYNTIETSGMIAHPDCVKVGEKSYIIEAKSANYWSAKRPEGSITKGYDLKLKTWQGIPLKHYMQIQFQMALFEINLAYLSLIWNTSEHQIWTIKANKKHQDQIMELVNNMIYHINKDIPPKDMAINQSDIKELYPELKQDFVMITGPEKEKAIELALLHEKAKKQEKTWKLKKEECEDSMSIMLKDVAELRDENGLIAKWQIRKGSERIKGLAEIKKIDNNAYKYLKKKSLISLSSDSRSVSIKEYKEE